MKPPIATKHPNATQVRSHNRRIIVGREDGNFIIEITAVFPESPPDFVATTKRGRYQIATMKLTKERMLELMYAIVSEMERVEETEL